jgi:hypothetical protein
MGCGASAEGKSGAAQVRNAASSAVLFLRLASKLEMALHVLSCISQACCPARCCRCHAQNVEPFGKALLYGRPVILVTEACDSPNSTSRISVELREG